MNLFQTRLLTKYDSLNLNKTFKNLCRYSCKLGLFDLLCFAAFILLFGGSLLFIFHWALPDDAFY